MKRLHYGLIIAGITFIIGVCVASVWIIQHRSHPYPSSVVNNSPRPSTFRNGDLLVKPDGWEIPDVSKIQISVPRKKWKGFAKTPVDVYCTWYRTDNIQISKSGFDGITDPVRKIRISDLRGYDIDGRTFCYRMMGWNVPLAGESGVGVLVYQTYYDLDGDGIFESWAIRDDILKPLRMPQWIQK